MAGCQFSEMTFPVLDAMKFTGVDGDPEQLVGNVSVTVFELLLLPAALEARTLNL